MERILEIVKTINGNQFVSYVARKAVRMNKKHNPYYERVEVIVKGTNQIGFAYQNGVNSRLGKQGLEKDYKSQSLRYGKWLKGFENKIIEHNGMLYLRTYKVKNQEEDKVYLLDGVVVSDPQILAEIKSFIPKENKTCAKQSEYGLDEENHLVVDNIRFDTIKRLAINKAVLEF